MQSVPFPLPQQSCSVHLYRNAISPKQRVPEQQQQQQQQQQLLQQQEGQQQQQHQQFHVLLLQLHQMLGSHQPVDTSNDKSQQQQQQQQEPSDSNSNIAGGGGGSGSGSGSGSGTSPAPAASSSSLKELLHECVRAVVRSEWETALQLLLAVSPRVSTQGDATERVCAFLAGALASRVGAGLGDIPASQLVSIPGVLPCLQPASSEELQAAYLALNQVTPFIRFAHLTANQAILEALHESAPAVHIVDLEIMQGVQWPPLMQALAQREPVPRLRITACLEPGQSAASLEQTGMRLAEFARSLDLPFDFATCARPGEGSLDQLLPPSSSSSASQDEALAVNCVLTLHRVLERGPGALQALLQAVKALRPQVVTLAEREANHNQPGLQDRFDHALHHYGALFDSLEATLPPRSPERVNVEHMCFGREIANIIACEGAARTERHQTSQQWTEFMDAAGFSHVPFSTFALAQARLLLRLHYPSEGYTLQEGDMCLFLGWQERPLYAVSSWS